MVSGFIINTHDGTEIELSELTSGSNIEIGISEWSDFSSGYINTIISIKDAESIVQHLQKQIDWYYKLKEIENDSR